MADQTSDITAPSSPADKRSALSSDAPVPSSPPSSPPAGFAWEENTPSSLSSPLRKPQVITAFSILGKRRAALSPTSANPRPGKHRKPQDAHKKSGPATPSTSGRTRQPPLTQLQISLGQRTRRTCPACAMEFVPSLPEDAKLHAEFHRDRVSGRGVGRSFVTQTPAARQFEGARHGDVVVRVDGGDAGPRRKLAEGVLGLVQGELGAVPLGDRVWEMDRQEGGQMGGEGSGRVGYLYVRERRVVGFLLVEGLKEALTVVGGGKGESDKGGGVAHQDKEGKGGSALEALRAKRRAKREAEVEAEKGALQLSKTNDKVRLGVSRVWTLEACRREGIAMSMMDAAARDHGIEDKAQVAFSQPTQAGARLARRWTGLVYGWHVYA